MILRLAWKSLLYRRWISILLVLSLASSVFLAISVERLRLGARESFSEVISQADLLVGARTGPINLLLYTLFGMGNATNNIAYSSYETLKRHPGVEWTIPFSLGDSHRGFRVIGTNESFFQKYRFRGDRSIHLATGSIPKGLSDVTIGSEVAKSLSYNLGDKIVLSHGMSGEGPDIYQHEDKPFTISGILKTTGTPIDWSLYVSLEALEWIHQGWQDGVPSKSAIQLDTPLQVRELTSFLVRMKKRIDSVYFQREINEFKAEPLMAIAPGVTLLEFWNSFRFFEAGLRFVSLFVAVISLMGLLVVLILSIEVRQREMMILRTIGLSARRIFSLILLEVGVLTVAGILLGLSLVLIGFVALRSPLEGLTGISIVLTPPSSFELSFVASLLLLSLLSALGPAWKLYQKGLWS